MKPSANKTDQSKDVGATGETAVRRNGLKVLLYDIESSPNIAYIWGKYEQDALGDFIQERQIISVAWKWLGEKQVHVFALPMQKTYKKNPTDNRELVVLLHKLFSEADLTVGHNVDQFDDPMSNSEFLIHGLPPPPPHRSVDTLKFIRHKFRFNSNKLGDLGVRLGVGKKVKHWGFELWARCLRGDSEAWALMMKYNKGDVVLLEKVYLKIRPWMTNHPDVNAADGHVGCPVCRSKKIQRRGWQVLNTGRYMRFQCMDCGKWSKGKLVHREWKFK